jgi:hypothetical protein
LVCQPRDAKGQLRQYRGKVHELDAQLLEKTVTITVGRPLIHGGLLRPLGFPREARMVPSVARESTLPW